MSDSKSGLPETFVPGFHDEAEVRKMKYIKFGNTGISVSQLSLGAGPFSMDYGEYTVEKCKATLHEAVRRGINYIDTAPYYGSGVSETVVGKCLEGIPRQAYYLATKVGRYTKDPKTMFDFSAKKTRESIDLSLKKLGVDHIDILQIHDIEFAPSLDVVLNETLPVLKEARDAKRARFIGVTGYPISTLAEFIKRSPVQLDMVLAYTRLSLVDNTLKEYLPLFKEKRLGIVNAAALGMGLLSNAGPQPWHPADESIKAVCTEARDYCKKNGVELGRLALHYAIKQDGPHTHLIGMNTVELLHLNLDIVQNGITAKEEEVLSHVENKIMTKLTKTHWEGFELERYWKAVQ